MQHTVRKSFAQTDTSIAFDTAVKNDGLLVRAASMKRKVRLSSMRYQLCLFLYFFNKRSFMKKKKRIFVNIQLSFDKEPTLEETP